MPSALLHPLVAACMAFAPAAPTSEPAPAAEPAADTATDDAPSTEAAPTDGTAEPATDAAEPNDAAEKPADDGETPTADGTAADTPVPTTDETPAPEPAAETSETEAPPAARQRPETVAAAPPRPPRAGPPSDGRRDDIVSKALLGGGLGSLGLGIALGGASTWLWIQRSQADRNVEALSPGAEENEARDQSKQFGTLATATTIAGSVYVVTGVALLLLHARDRKRVSATPTVGAVNGVVVQGRF